MENLIKSIKAHLYDRATSPLFGTFAVSWVIWNYKFVLVLFSSMPVIERFDYISTSLYPDCSVYFFQGILYPILTSAFFIFGYPFPARIVYCFARKQQKALREIKQEIEDETPLTKKESRRIYRDMANLELEFEKELDQRGSEIQRLKEIIKQLNPESASGPEESDTPSSKMGFKENPPDWDGKQLSLLKLISNHDKYLESTLISQAGGDKIKTEYNLGELLNGKLITAKATSAGKAYNITHQGRALLVKKGLVD